MVRPIALAALASAVLSFAAPAAADEAQDWVRLRLGSVLRADTTWDQVRSAMMAFYRASNPGERGVTPAGLEALTQIARAQVRASAIMHLLTSDLDGDGRVTRDEFVTALTPRARQPIHANGVQLDPTRDQVRQQLDKLIADALLADLDGDGIVTVEEARKNADAKATQGQAGVTGWHSGQQIPMSLDADTDEAVSLAEFEGAIRREFDDVDKDRDGRISSEEARAFGESMRSVRQAAARLENERRQRAEAEAAARACSPAKPPADARIVVLGTYEGRALSNVSIGGDDRETTVANIEVAPGREPLFIVVTSYDAMVWRVWGSTERVAGMFVSSLAADKASGRPRAGVVGLSREKIQFAPKAGCLRYFTQNDNERAATLRSAEILFGRTPADVSGIYAAESFKAPSGQHLTWTPAALNSIQLPETGPGAPMWKEMLRYNPAGLANIDPITVVSPLPVKRYAVLPQQAGLAQLLEEGALAVAATTRGVQIEGTKVTPFAMPGTFLITRKTMFPAGLNGAHSVRFILARGVPMPDGDPGHSCVLEEETGRPTQSRPGC